MCAYELSCFKNVKVNRFSFGCGMIDEIVVLTGFIGFF
jgi:hypothetical protein